MSLSISKSLAFLKNFLSDFLDLLTRVKAEVNQISMDEKKQKLALALMLLQKKAPGQNEDTTNSRTVNKAVRLSFMLLILYPGATSSFLCAPD